MTIRLIGCLVWFLPALLSAEQLTRFSFTLSAEPEWVLPQNRWVLVQQRSAPFLFNGTPSDLVNRQGFIIGQRRPQWLLNIRAGLRWRPQQNIEFRLKGNRLSSQVNMPTLWLCSKCNNTIKASIWRDGDVHINLTSHFD